MSTEKQNAFEALGVPSHLAKRVQELGYETPSPVQKLSIPILSDKANVDLVAQAQTGTGKTAAFALPILAKIDLSIKSPQAIIIAPTRELAIQVAEAFQSYAKSMKRFHVTPIYGGQDYQVQLRALKRGSHVIVGTPGRLMDHMRRGTLSTAHLQTLILDEGDEMLRMGFVEDIEWILEQIDQPHQTALFSATMPAAIQKIAKKYLKDPQSVKIKSQKNTADNIEQSYILLANTQKLEVLTRYLEVESFQAAIIFVRTKNSSSELAEKLQARGYAAAALNGDMNQSAREKVISRIKSGSLDIVIATDVAARGIDVERISHVINYDIPHDIEAYVHRIGRTGRAGRQGKALLLVTPRERRLLKDIENTLPSDIKQTTPPSLQEMTDKRSIALKDKIECIIKKSKKIKPYYQFVNKILEENEFGERDVAAALIYLYEQSNPLPTEDIILAAPSSEHKRSRRRSVPPSRREGGRRSNSQHKMKTADNKKRGPANKRGSAKKNTSVKKPSRRRSK